MNTLAIERKTIPSKGMKSSQAPRRIRSQDSTVRNVQVQRILNIFRRVEYSRVTSRNTSVFL